MNKKTLTIILALAVGLLFDILFWGHLQIGLNYTLFIWACLAAALTAARLFKVKLPVWNWLIVALILFFSTMFLFRKEPFTGFLNLGISFFLLMILVSEFRQINWLKYGFLDWVKQGFLVFFRLFTNPVKLQSKKVEEEVEKEHSSQWAITRRIVVGLLITLPVLYIFIQLLGSADAVFEEKVGSLLDIFKLENLAEYIIRIPIMLFVAWFASGALMTAVKDSLGTTINKEDPGQKLVGFVESMILFVSVNLLFLLFTFIQFSYFFGGDEGRMVAGLTYSEYAVKGFSELTIVAVFSLLLIFAISSFYREKDVQKHKFVLAAKTLLVIQVLIILVSAFQRLMLYEEAYGFTRLRMYSHIYMIWLAVLLVASLVLLYLKKPGRFAIASLAVLMGFAITINVVNVDGLILRNNINRMYTNNTPIQADGSSDFASRRTLDSNFLLSLSSDIVPTLIDISDNSAYGGVHSRVDLVIACYLHNNVANSLIDERDWQSFHISEHTNHQKLLGFILRDPLGVDMVTSEDGWPVTAKKDGFELDCNDSWFYD